MAASDWIQLGAAIVLTLTLIVLGRYAYDTRNLARSTHRMAESSMRPVLVQWIDKVALPNQVLRVHYRNFGNGPAINIAWALLRDGQDVMPPGKMETRVGMATDDAKALEALEFNPPNSTSLTLVAQYTDAYGTLWESHLEIVANSGALENGTTWHGQIPTRTLGAVAAR